MKCYNRVLCTKRTHRISRVSDIRENKIMATNDKRLRVTELDFDNIKTNLKTFLKSQEEFKDYDFEGSGMNILLDVLHTILTI